MDARKQFNFFIFFVQKILEIAHFRLQRPNPLLQRLGVSSRKRSSTQLVASLALESDRGALAAARADAVASDFFAPTSIAGLGNTALGVVAHLDHFHRQDARHGGDLSRVVYRK